MAGGEESVREFYAAVAASQAALKDDPVKLAPALENGTLPPATEALMRHFDPDVVWRPVAVDQTVHRGRLEMLRYWDEVTEMVEEYRLTPGEIEDLGDDRYFVTLERYAKGRHTDMELTQPLFVILTLEDGVVTEMNEYAERAEALQAIGRSPSA